MTARTRSRARWACVVVIGAALTLLLLYGFDLVWPPLMWGSLCLAVVAAVLLGQLDIEDDDEVVFLDPPPLTLNWLDLGPGGTRWRVVNDLTGRQVGEPVYTFDPADVAEPFTYINPRSWIEQAAEAWYRHQR